MMVRLQTKRDPSLFIIYLRLSLLRFAIQYSCHTGNTHQSKSNKTGSQTALFTSFRQGFTFFTYWWRSYTCSRIGYVYCSSGGCGRTCSGSHSSGWFYCCDRCSRSCWSHCCGSHCSCSSRLYRRSCRYSCSSRLYCRSCRYSCSSRLYCRSCRYSCSSRLYRRTCSGSHSSGWFYCCGR